MPAQRARSCVGHRPAARDEATGEVGERLGMRQLAGLRARSPVVEQDERRLLALHRPDADEPVTGEPRDDVVPPLPGRRDAGVLEQAEHVGTAQPAVARERLAEEVATAIELGRGDAELRAAALLGDGEARGAQRQQPAHVLRRREVDGAAHQPRAHDLADRRSRAPPSRPSRAGAASRSAHSDWP